MGSRSTGRGRPGRDTSAGASQPESAGGDRIIAWEPVAEHDGTGAERRGVGELQPYLQAYGPATIERFDAWLTRGASGKGTLLSWFAAIGDDLVTVAVEGTSAYLLAEDVEELAATDPTVAVRLLPAFDQYVLGPADITSRIRSDGDDHRRDPSSGAADLVAPVGRQNLGSGGAGRGGVTQIDSLCAAIAAVGPTRPGWRRGG